MSARYRGICGISWIGLIQLSLACGSETTPNSQATSGTQPSVDNPTSANASGAGVGVNAGTNGGASGSSQPTTEPTGGAASSGGGATATAQGGAGATAQGDGNPVGSLGGAGSAAGGAASVTTAGSGGSAPAVGGAGATLGGGAAVPDGMGGATSADVDEMLEPAIGDDGFLAECVETFSLPAEASMRTSVNLAIELGGEPFVFGEPNALAAGGTVLPTNFRFYLSQLALTRGEEHIPVTLVGADDVPLPYGVQLVSAEDPESLSFSFAAPPGSYDGLFFLLGLSNGCNSRFAPAGPPLDEASQLKWPHTLGFLFLRFEGQLSAEADPALPDAIHMGAAAGDDGGPPGFLMSVPVEGDAPSIDLTMAFDAILQGATTETDLSDFSLLPPAPPMLEEEILAGERLRRAVGSVELFRSRTTP